MNYLNKIFIIILFFSLPLKAQDYWQQRVKYIMDIDFDINKHQYTGVQNLEYFNNSPDTLYKVYFHLYFNAFQPNSMMDMRSRSIKDPDRRVKDRIFYLKENEIGFIKVQNLTQNAQPLKFHVENTVLEVTLTQPILPKSKMTFKMNFEGQVPLQIRRSGRNSTEGVTYSMAQWFPKMAEYDKNGWHAHPYVGREFYAPWGDFEVNISIDKKFVVAASGILQNPDEIGMGYESENTKIKNQKGDKNLWKFKGQNIHDFMWAADPNYIHKKHQVPNGPLVHFFYLNNENTKNWELLPAYVEKMFQFLNANFGVYPYSDFYVIQGGDGGMEYPMSTLITGQRELEELVSVTVHEALHSWYQGVLATNESYYAWMDEGFTTYASSLTMEHLFPETNKDDYLNNYLSYYNLVKSGLEEPLTTHSDHFNTNFAYGRAAYSKGAVSVSQLGYIIGEKNLKKGLNLYFNTWKFKHPTSQDYLRIMEKVSKLELDWYFDFWVNTTKTIDYAVDSVFEKDKKTNILLKKIGEMPMPIEVEITDKDDNKTLIYIPLGVMRGEKENESTLNRKVLKDWYWTHPEYSFQLDIPLERVKKIEIDPSKRMADINQENNLYKN